MYMVVVPPDRKLGAVALRSRSRSPRGKPCKTASCERGRNIYKREGRSEVKTTERENPRPAHVKCGAKLSIRPFVDLNLLATTNGEDLESDGLELVGVEDATAVEDEAVHFVRLGGQLELGGGEDEDVRRLSHTLVDGLPVESLELVPLCCGEGQRGREERNKGEETNR